MASLAEKFFFFPISKGAFYRELLRRSAHCSVVLFDKVPCDLVFGNIFGAGRLRSGGSGDIRVVINLVLLVAVRVNANVRAVDGNASGIGCHIEFGVRCRDGWTRDDGKCRGG